MGTSLSVADNQVLLVPREANGDVLRCVEHQEWLERVFPRTVLWGILGIGFLTLLARNSWQVTGGLLIGGAVLLFVAKLAVGVACSLVLEPSRYLRFRSAAKKLSSRLERAAVLTCPPCSWYTGAPGAFAVTDQGELLLADRSSGYELLRLTPDQVARVSVEREVTQVTRTRHSGRSIIGGVNGGFLGGWVSGGQSTSVSHDIEQAYLEISYQLEPNGLVRLAAVPFGSDRRGAMAACAMVSRLQR